MFSCEDKIDIEIPNSASKLVVEGIIYKQEFPTNYTIIISRSSNFSDSLHPNIIENPVEANLTLISSDGISTPLMKTPTKGAYSLRDSLIEYNKSYKLRIETLDNEIYESTYQKAHEPVRFDSISHLPYEYLQGHGYFFDIINDKKSDYVVASFTDRKNEENYYGWIWLHHGLDLSKMKLLSDLDIGDGNTVPFEYLWFNVPVGEISSGNLMYQATLNKNAYNYLTEV